MLKRLTLILTLASLLVTPVLAADLGGPTTNSNYGSDPTTLNTLQPATPTVLQSGTPQGSLNGTTSGAQLQPAGSRSDLPASFSNDISGSAPSPSQPGANRSNQIELGLLGAFIAICAYFMYRISKQLEDRTTQTVADANSIQGASVAGEDAVIEGQPDGSESDSVSTDTPEAPSSDAAMAEPVSDADAIDIAKETESRKPPKPRKKARKSRSRH